MKQKLKAHFMNLGPRRFVGGTVLLLFILDIINSYYLKLWWLKKDISRGLMTQSIQRGQLVLSDFSQETLVEMTKFIDNCFYFFLIVILANNLFFYFFYLRKKLWAQGYVLFYTLTAALFSLTFIFDHAGLGWGWILYNCSTIFVYVYLYLGVKLLKNETTLLPQKKGQ
jgi:hypothetical protein